MENHLSRPEIRQAMTESVGRDIRDSQTMGYETYYYAVLLPNGEILRMAQDAETVWSIYHSTLPAIVLSCVALMLAAAVLAVCLSLPAMASAPLVRDDYGLFDGDTLSALEADAEEAADGHDCDVYFLTVDSIGDEDQRAYAKNYYRDNDLGSGSDRSGILFMIALGSRKYVTITYGGGVTAFTDYRIEQIEDEVVPMLSDGDYADAAQTYIDLCADTLDFYAENGEPLDYDNDPDGDLGIFGILIVVGIPSLIAAIVCSILYAQMKTAKRKTEADDYIGAGLKLRVQRDHYTHTDRVQVYDPPHEESSSSGGSSVDSDGFGGSSGGSF